MHSQSAYPKRPVKWLPASMVGVFGLLISLAAHAQAPASAAANDGRQTVRLAPQVRELPLGSGTPAIPRATIEKFLSGNLIVAPESYANSPYIVASASGNLVIGAGDEVYVQGDWSDALATYDVIRPGTTYVDPATDEVLGMEAVYLGTINMVPGVDEVRRGTIRNTRRELKAGDRLLPRDARELEHTFHPARPQSEVKGTIIGLLGDKALAAQYDAVVIDRGEREGIKSGDLLGIYDGGTVVQDPVTKKNVTLPGRHAGELLIYRSFEKVSYGLILKSTQPTSIDFTVRHQ